MKNRLPFIAAVFIILALLHFHPLKAQDWVLGGNGNASSTSKLGTTNEVPLRLFTNNAERLFIDPSGNVGIGTNYPVNKLHVEGIGLFTQGVSASNGGIIGYNTGNSGVYGNGAVHGVYGVGRTFGIYGSSTGGGHGVDGWSSYLGVYGNGGSYGIYGASNYIGAYGSGSTYGVYGTGTNSGVYGSGTSYGVNGNSTSGIGTVGRSTNYLGGYFYSANSYGIRAATGLSSKNWAGVFDGNIIAYGSYHTSDKNLKRNIEDLTGALDLINQLKPRRYEFRRDGTLASLNLPEGKHYGLLAQELEAVLPGMVREVQNDVSPEMRNIPAPVPGAEEKGLTTPVPPKEALPGAGEKMTTRAVNYIELIPVMIKAIQELSEENKALQQQLDELKKTLPSTTGQTVSGLSAQLGQSSPNPVQTDARITYVLPRGANKAHLVLSDNLGRIVKRLRLNASGFIRIDASGLENGVYQYSLVVDDQTLETRKLTVLK